MANNSSGLDRTAFEMQRMLERQPTVCAVCQLVNENMRKHIDVLFFERVTDIPTREAIRKSKGFCRVHARMVSEQADAVALR